MDAHEKAFVYFEGIPQKKIYDQALVDEYRLKNIIDFFEYQKNETPAIVRSLLINTLSPGDSSLTSLCSVDSKASAWRFE